MIGLAEITMEEDFNQIMRDNLRISRIMLTDDRDIQDGLQDMLYGYVKSINTNLFVFQRNYQGQTGFDYLYKKLRDSAKRQVREVMEKYNVPIKQEIAEAGK